MSRPVCLSLASLRTICGSSSMQRPVLQKTLQFPIRLCRRELSTAYFFGSRFGFLRRSNGAETSRPNLERKGALNSKVLLLRSTRFSSSGKAPGSTEGDDKKPSLNPSSLQKSINKITTHENIYTIPNILTFTRLVAAPMIGYCILHSNHVMALSLFAYASITDLVDGYIARRFKQQTVVGTVIDPMADKFLMTVGVVCLAIKSAIPLWLAGLILARDVGLAISAIYYRWISLPPPKTMARYWDFSLPSAEVKPTQISKVNTALQFLLVGSAMALPVVPEAILSAWSLNEAMVGLQYLVALTTAWSGLGYIGSKNAVKILTQQEKGKEEQKDKH